MAFSLPPVFQSALLVMIKFGDTSPAEAVQQLVDRTGPVKSEVVPVADPAELTGRVLAEPLRLDRDSPACDVSAMDGFAVRHAELVAGPLPVAGECRIGRAPVELPSGAAVRVYTGSPLPLGADTVVRLERVTESDGRLAAKEEHPPQLGQDIRCRGENAASGDAVLPAGQPITSAAVGAVATIGSGSLSLHRALRVAILTTGDEVVGHKESLTRGESLPAWTLRNSNGPVLAAVTRSLAFVEGVEHLHVGDAEAELADRLAAAVAAADCVVLTGGVSQGAYDFVRAAIESIDGEVLFHGVTARPGRPTLGAVVGETPVLGLPGNPVAVMTTSRRLLLPVLRRRAGFDRPDPPTPLVKLREWPGKTLPLSWWRPVTLTGAGEADLAPLRGSGDVCGPASTDGFIEAPPGADGTGPFPFYAWLP